MDKIECVEILKTKLERTKECLIEGAEIQKAFPDMPEMRYEENRKAFEADVVAYELAIRVLERLDVDVIADKLAEAWHYSCECEPDSTCFQCKESKRIAQAIITKLTEE
jgi:hypothetical protein